MERKERFSAKKVARILRKHLDDNLDTHQHRGEFVEGCIQCEKCLVIRQIAGDLHNVQINYAVYGKPSRIGKTAFTRGIHGERLLTNDTDMRVRGRTRAGK